MSQPDHKADAFRRQIIKWFGKSGRAFPWRERAGAYGVLIAELMLRRTRAEQVVPVYEKFLSRFPDPRTLALAKEKEIHECLRPLGLAWRVPAFREIARRLMQDYEGEVPNERAALLSLPGVGDYVASAVRCVAFNEPEVLVDTNTVRLSGRYYGIQVSPASRRNKGVRQAISKLVDQSRPRESNLGLIDFAAAVCRPVRPLCEICPVAWGCAWRRATTREAVAAEALA